ncbi:MAG: group II intron reverse transcriptase/maturase, partial [Deltaproteobacteria bacterium]|nr:group II intron reverse transcriptase/maturase [Deltaproteobacteria bacterium]
MKQTSLLGIANKAASDKAHRFQNLFGLLTVGYLLACWRFVNKKAASGVDRKDAKSYEENLRENVEGLVEAVRGGWYRAKLVLRKYIPKLNGKLRPLGIPAIADKLLQIGVSKILEEIYEQDFLGCSYGYQPGVGALDAIRDLSAVLRSRGYHYLVEADIRGFFDNLDHEKLIELLELRIDDKAFIRLIRKWLKAGILEPDGAVEYPEKGSPQGGIVSPILANIYLHYALDVWFEETVKVHCRGAAYLCRYADDFVCAFESKTDAERFYHVLEKRLGKFGLEVAAEK